MMDISKARKRKSSNSSFSKENAKCGYLSDIDNLTRTELRKKYPLTYNSWRNMKQRSDHIAEAFREFPDFLRNAGPRPGKGYTLDRLDNNDPEYAPEKAAWKDKRDQANNRSTTKYLECDGERKPLSQWARETDQRPATLRRRLKQGWSHSEVIHGRGKTTSESDDLNSINYLPWGGSKAEKEEGERSYLRYGKPNEDRLEYYLRMCYKKKRELTKELIEMERTASHQGYDWEPARLKNQIAGLEDRIEKVEEEYDEWWDNVGRDKYARR